MSRHSAALIKIGDRYTIRYEIVNPKNERLSKNLMWVEY